VLSGEHDASAARDRQGSGGVFLARPAHQLQNAENRIAQLENRIRELEAAVELYKAKMERAKQWLRTLFSQIEERLFG
jgi:chromosome segregation ATPase